jgi:hypothetical protein
MANFEEAVFLHLDEHPVEAANDRLVVASALQFEFEDTLEADGVGDSHH